MDAAGGMAPGINGICEPSDGTFSSTDGLYAQFVTGFDDADAVSLYDLANVLRYWMLLEHFELL